LKSLSPGLFALVIIAYGFVIGRSGSAAEHVLAHPSQHGGGRRYAAVMYYLFDTKNIWLPWMVPVFVQMHLRCSPPYYGAISTPTVVVNAYTRHFPAITCRARWWSNSRITQAMSKSAASLCTAPVWPRMRSVIPIWRKIAAGRIERADETNITKPCLRRYAPGRASSPT